MNRILQITMLGILSGMAVHSNASDQVGFSGSLDIVSQYISRGLTNSPENDAVALQASLNASWEQFYLFYWGSTINYSFREIQTGNAYSADEFEHDLGLGYGFNIGDLKVDLWDAFYYYQGGQHTTSNEIGITLTKQLSEKSDLRMQISTYLYDVVYMNQWDSYIQLDYTHRFNDKFSTILSTGFSYFNDNGKYEGGTFLNTQSDFTYRFASAQLNYLIQPNITGYGRFISGGYDRADMKQKNTVLIGLNYAF